MLAGSLITASSLMRPWQERQASKSTAMVRASSSAQGRYPPARSAYQARLWFLITLPSCYCISAKHGSRVGGIDMRWLTASDWFPEVAVALTAVLFLLSIVHSLVGDFRTWWKEWRDWLEQ